MKNKTVCFTGHRNITDDRKSIEESLKNTLIDLIEKGYCYFGAGGALGFDSVAAITVLKLKERYPHIKLILVLPCRNQTRGWQERDIKIYNDIMSKADKVVYTAENYYNGCMHKRYRHLVNNSSVCVCYLTEETGGTFYTVNYARKNNLRIINVAEDILIDK